MNVKMTGMGLGLLLAACSAAAAPDTYTLVTSVPESYNGSTAFLVNFDSGEKIDSVKVTNGSATFHGEAQSKYPARVIVGGQPYTQVFIDGGNIAAEKGSASGSVLNDRYREIARHLQALGASYEAVPNDSLAEGRRKAIETRYNAYTDSVFKANADNALGYTMFLDMAYTLTLPELQEALKKYPQMKESQRVTKLLTAAVNKAETQPGYKFKDFTITTDSVTESLSDYVGKGKPVLVDFWASWCGPCMRQAKVLKEIYSEYADKGLEVLGVAVWDEPENTQKAIRRHQLPWHNIINAQTIPTDIYGISGIPCIILFGPDGTILSRDKQGDELRADVKAYFEGTLGAPEAAADSTATSVAAAQ